MAYSTPPTKSTGDTISATNWNTHLKGNLDYLKARADALDYVQITAPVNLAAASEGAADTIITGTSVAYDNVRKRVEFWCPSVDNESAGVIVNIIILRGATVLGVARVENSDRVNVDHKTEFFDPTPTAGTYAYVVKAFSSSAGAGIVNAGTGGSAQLFPAFLRVTYDA